MKALAIALLSCILTVQTCSKKYPGEPLCIDNDTNKMVYYWFSYWKNNPGWTSYHYPNTLPEERPRGIRFITPRGSSCPAEADPNWVQIFSELPEGKFTVYFFMENPATQAQWDAMRANNDYFRKDVTYEELVSNRYIIAFP